MLNQSSLKAVTMIIKGKVIPKEATFGILFFEVDKVEVTFDLRKKLWMCQCRHEVWRGANVKKICKHIKACQWWLQVRQRLISKKAEVKR